MVSNNEIIFLGKLIVLMVVNEDEEKVRYKITSSGIQTLVI